MSLVCVALMFHSSLFGSRPRPIFSAILVHLFGAYQCLDGSIHTYSNEPHATNREITPGFVLI